SQGGVEDLVEAIRKVAAGQRYFSAALSEPALGTYIQQAEGKPIDPFDTLTLREREVLQLTVEGHSGIEISGRLHISPRTVETHRANLMRKLSVRNQKELIRYAVQRGMVASEPKPLTASPPPGGQPPAN